MRRSGSLLTTPTTRRHGLGGTTHIPFDEFGTEQRKVPAHMPHMIDTEVMKAMHARWTAEVRDAASQKTDLAPFATRVTGDARALGRRVGRDVDAPLSRLARHAGGSGGARAVVFGGFVCVFFSSFPAFLSGG